MVSQEYNKIHALALARRKVMQKFGSSLLSFWPLVDDTPLIRDLMRVKPLFGFDGIDVQGNGMIDYAVDMAGRIGDAISHYISDTVPDVGDLSLTTGQVANFTAAVVPTGRWTSFKFKSNKSSSQTVFFASAGMDQGDVANDYMVSVNTDVTGSGPWTHTAVIPFPLDAPPGVWWAFMPQQTYFKTGLDEVKGKEWVASAWVDKDDLVVEFIGAVSPSWSTFDDFTVIAFVNVDKSPANGVLFSLSDSSESKLKITIKSDKKVEGKIKNTNGDVYTRTSPEILHLGFNMITLSYEKSVKVKLGINGKVVSSEVPSAFGLFNATLALSIGSQMMADKTTFNDLDQALICDVAMASSVMSDADLWDLYMSYITAAPLMLVDDVTPLS